jgi:preprotein translocase subunit SecG
MRFKKPLASTMLFAGIFLVGIIILYILVSEALETDENIPNNDTISDIIKVKESL